MQCATTRHRAPILPLLASMASLALLSLSKYGFRPLFSGRSSLQDCIVMLMPSLLLSELIVTDAGFTVTDKVRRDARLMLASSPACHDGSR